jgi:hypothetical protein
LAAHCTNDAEESSVQPDNTLRSKTCGILAPQSRQRRYKIPNPSNTPASRGAQSIRRAPKRPYNRSAMKAEPLISEQRLAHLSAGVFAWIGWLFSVVLRIGILSRSRGLLRLVRRAERSVEGLVFLMAVRRAPPPLRRRRRLPQTQRPGFRRAHGSVRLLLKSARLRAKGAGLGMRVMRLCEVLADPEVYVSHFLKRILRGLRGTSFVATTPPAFAIGSEHAPPPALQNSS